MAINGNIRPDYRPIGSNGKVLIADSTNVNGTSWQTLYDADIADDFVMSSLSGETQVFWTNQTISSGNLSLSWSGNETIASGQTITADSNTVAFVEGQTSGFWPYNLQKTTPNSSISFTHTGQGVDSSGSSNIQWTASWRQKIFYGASDTGVYNSGFILALPSNTFSVTGDISFSDVANTGQYFYYAFRSDAGTPTFTDTDSNLKGGFSLISESISLTNPYGYTEEPLYRLLSDVLL